MEIRSTIAAIRNKVRLCLSVLAILAFLPAAGQHRAMTMYSIKDGEMYIELGRDITGPALDSFIAKFNLSGIGLKGLVENNDGDSLEKAGWKIRARNKNILAISKRLEGPDQIGSPGDRILFTEKHPTLDELFPATNNGVVYGHNRFKNKFPFAERDSIVTFFLRKDVGAVEVLLAGSFTGWDKRPLRMQSTDSGWIARVKLKPGKYWYKFIVDYNWTADADNLLRENDGMGNINSVYYKSNVLFTLGQFNNAKRVYLSGSFNNWKSSELAMTKTAMGWQLPLYLANGTYTYRFVVDGNWMIDPANADKFPNEYNDYNSVIRIGKPHLFSLIGYANARQVMLAGSFNNWHNYELPMHKTASGWELQYTLGGGNYEYGFIIDGKRIADPANPVPIDNHSYLVVEPNFTFHLKGYADASKVYLSGDFDSWSPNTLVMKKEGGEWVCSIHLSAGKHLYKFIIDGQWIIDPANPLWEQNQMGTGNSIIWMN